MFYSWLRSYVRPEFVVLNLGAGASSNNKVRSLKGEVRKVIGADIDHEVLSNADLDEAFIVEDDILPFSNNTFDLIWADYVFEHVMNPRIFLNQACRVLRPGASFFFRTPNKYHYVSLFAWMTPHWFHNLIANRIRGFSDGVREPYPTYYRLNSNNDIIRHSKSAGFRKINLWRVEAEPSYLMFHYFTFLAGVLYERIVNSFDSLSWLRANIFGRLEK